MEDQVGERAVMVFALYHKPRTKPFIAYILTLWWPHTSERGLLRSLNHARESDRATQSRIAGISKSDRILLGAASYLGDVPDEFHLGVG